MSAQLFAVCIFLRVCYVQIFAIRYLLRVRWRVACQVWIVCYVSTPFLRKFLIRVREEVSQKSVFFDAIDASKKLHV